MEPASVLPTITTTTTASVSPPTPPKTGINDGKNKQINLEGKTVHEALEITAGGQVSEVMSLKGKFPKELDQKGGAVVATSYETGTDKCFKFDVTWTAKIKDNQGNEKDVEFTQTIFTDVKIPKEGSVQDFESSKQKAYQVAKSYELIQRQLTPPESRGQEVREESKKQMEALQKESLIMFIPKESTIEKKEGIGFEAKTLKTGTQISFTAEKVNKATKESISRLATMASQRVILVGERDNSFGEFEGYEASAQELKIPDEKKEDYVKFLHEKFTLYKKEFENQMNLAEGDLNKVKESENREDIQNLKKELGRLQSTPITVENRGAAGTSPIDPHLLEGQAKEKRDGEISNVKNEIVQNSNLARLEKRTLALELAHDRMNSIFFKMDKLGLNNINDLVDTVNEFEEKINIFIEQKENVEKSLFEPPKVEVETEVESAGKGKEKEIEVKERNESMDVELEAIGEKTKLEGNKDAFIVKIENEEKVKIENEEKRKVGTQNGWQKLKRFFGFKDTPPPPSDHQSSTLPPSDLPPPLPPSDLPPPLPPSDLPPPLPPSDQPPPLPTSPPPDQNRPLPIPPSPDQNRPLPIPPSPDQKSTTSNPTFI